MHNSNKNIKVIKFSRNFGKEMALTAGLDYVSGDVIIPIDADLQDPPSLISDMVKEYENGYDMVLMKRVHRNESLIKRFTANMFYSLMDILTHKRLPKNVGDFRLMSSRVVREINRLRERNRFMKGLLSWSGFKTTTLLYDRPKRKRGKPKQNSIKLVSLALDGIFSFSTLPIKIWSVLGTLVSFCSFIYGIWLIVVKIFNLHYVVNGYTSTLVIILFFNGLIMIGIGILGEYIGRIYDEVKQRPLYIIDELLDD